MVLKQGSSGPDVKALQQQLKDLGFDPNGVDGNFGPGTDKAVRAFQQANGLGVDGNVGPGTLAALQSAAGATANATLTASTPAGASTAAAGAAPATAPNLNLAALTGKLPQSVIDQIPEAAAKFGISTNLRLAHFLAQCALESTNFTATVENMNYSAQRLLQVFPKYFKNVDVNAYARNPQKIGSRVYANRMGNGDEASGDGFRYRGRGYIQLTGKNNYQSFTDHIGEDCVANPDLVATKYPLASAGFFFNSNNIWALCDQGASDATVTSVTKRVNGGTHGLAERIQNFKKFRAALGS
ncbi:MAG TPA: peptidoglycan-binding protein [Pyrinomonadaceae bacterium]|nr:peptidoglycan-binding protein [Pyrinomonadaceae bacterium]